MSPYRYMAILPIGASSLLLELQRRVELLRLVKLLDLRLAHQRLEAEVGRRGEADRPDGARLQEADGQRRGGQEEALLGGLHQGDALERLLELEGAHADLELALLHGAHRLLQVGYPAGRGDGHVHVLRVEAGGLLELLQALAELRHVLAEAHGLGEPLDEGLRELADVEVLVQALADAVDTGEGAEDEGEGGREPEDLRLRVREHGEVRADGLLDVRRGLAQLDVLEAPHEEAGQLLDGEAVRAAREHAHGLHRVHELPRVLGELEVVDHGPAGEEGHAELPEALADVGAELVHHAEVVVDELALLVHAEVAGVGVAVEVAGLHDLPQEGVGDLLRQLLAVQAEALDLPDVRELQRGEELHGQDPRGAHLAVGDRHAHVLDVFEVLLEAGHVVRLVHVVDLQVEEAARLREDGEPVAVRAVALGVEGLQELGQLPEVLQVHVEELLQPRPLHLDRDLLALVGGRVHLAQGGGL
mmetsp:Transcript_48784/g.143991  ORF Transcript_48784/g.143991 Transcript_48784/m.143991 type:complete len:474 (+) Transcript_48784:317-1738(+)